MGRKMSYRRKKKIKLKPIIIIVLIIIIIIAICFKIFSSVDYKTQVKEIISSDILKFSGNISKTSSVDTKVYINDGIRYTNKHEDIEKINSFDSSIQDDSGKVEAAKKLFENIDKLEEIGYSGELPSKQDGYYWIEANIVSEHKKLIFADEEDNNFDLYYDIENEVIYIKNKYYDEFSKKNNKTKLLSYKTDDETKKLIEELAIPD